MKVFAAVLLLTLAVASQALTWEKPEFCGKSECPPFELKDDRDSYEVRTYDKGHWVQYNVTDKKYEIAYTKANAALMKYFKGHNKDELTMDLTTPTLAALKLSKDAQESERNYVFSMWLDPEDFEEDQDEPPKPEDENLKIIEYPETTVFVRTFGGFATESTILNEATALHEELVSDKEEFEDQWVFVAVYDSAIKLLNRHNEVHVMKKPAPSTKALPRFFKGNQEDTRFLVQNS